MGGRFPLQGIFLTQGLNPGLLHCRQIPYSLSYGVGGAILASQCSAFLHPLAVSDRPGGWRAEVRNTQDG